MIKILISYLFILSCYSSESIGFYSNGKVKESVSIDSYHSHFEKLFRTRGQLYSTTFLLDFVIDFIDEIKNDYPNVEKVQIGDISAKHGGKINRHQSHQNGLDIDVVYLRTNRRGQRIDNPEWGEYFTSGEKLTKNFDVKRNWKLFQNITSHPEVGRIFVDWAVKRKFCELYGSSSRRDIQNTLRHLRPAKYHKTHFHLRLKCPSSDKKCKKQAPPSAGTGCSNLALEEL